MALTTRQEATYQGKHWWSWAVWLDGPAAELDAVRSVTWLLHPTFPNPERTTTDRASAFRIDSAGWGEFTLQANVVHHDGTRTQLRHDLVLEVPETEERAPMRGMSEPPPPRVIIASSAMDERIASTLRKHLGLHGVDVIRWEEEPGLESLEEAVYDATRGADAVVALMSEAGARSVQQEVEAARKQRKPIVLVDVGGFQSHSGMPAIPLKSEHDVADVIESLVEQIHASTRRKR